LHWWLIGLACLLFIIAAILAVRQYKSGQKQWEERFDNVYQYYWNDPQGKIQKQRQEASKEMMHKMLNPAYRRQKKAESWIKAFIDNSNHKWTVSFLILGVILLAGFTVVNIV
jgi:hypothetical protein